MAITMQPPTTPDGVGPIPLNPQTTSDFNTDPPQIPPPLQTRRVAGNAAIYLVGQVVTWLVTFLSVSLIPRYLGEEAMGQYAIAATTVSTVSAFLLLGIDQFLITEIGRDREQTEPLIRATFGLRLALLPVMIAVVFGLLFFNRTKDSNADAAVLVLTLPLTVGLVISCFAGPLRQIMVGWEDAKRVALYDVRSALAPLVALPFLRFGVIALPITSIVFAAPLQIALGLWLRRKIRFAPTFNVKEWICLIRGGLPFVTNDALLILYVYGSFFFLRRYAGEASVGLVSQAQRLQGTSLFVPTAIVAALLPAMSRLVEQNRDEFRALQKRMFGIMIALGLPVAALLFLLATPLCHLLYGTQKFQGMPPVLQACAFNVIPLYITSVIYRFLVAERKSTQWSIFLLGTVALNTGLCAVTIPWFMDRGSAGVGAVAASVVAETLTVIAAFVLLKNNPLDARTILQIGKAAVATLGLSIVVLLTRHLFIVIPAALGGITFLAIAWFLGVLEPGEREKLSAMLQQKLRRRPR